jgi:vacuolar-type H+-ATPase subunit I/STV1
MKVDSFKYLSVMFVFGLATMVMNFTIAYAAYALAPTPTVIVVVCLGLRWLSSNTALTIIDEIIKKDEEKKNE